MEMNSKSLQTALVYFIADADLPFSVVKRKSFRNLVYLINKQAGPLISQISRQIMSSHLSRVYLQTQEKVKIDYLSKQTHLLFTQDAWTALNVTAFMGITAHFIDSSFKLIDLTISVPHVQGMFCFPFFSQLTPFIPIVTSL